MTSIVSETSREVRWRRVLWLEVGFILALFTFVPLVTGSRDSRKEWIIAMILVAVIAIGRGISHWLFARKGWRSVGLRYDKNGFSTPEFPAEPVPWHAVTAINPPESWSRAAVVQLADPAYQLTPPPWIWFLTVKDSKNTAAVLLSGWKLNANLHEVVAEMQALHEVATKSTA